MNNISRLQSDLIPSGGVYPRAPPKDKQRPSPHNTMRQIVDI